MDVHALPFNLAVLTSTPDIRSVSPAHARMVGALRYAHMARASRCYCPAKLAGYLGSRKAIYSFRVFLNEAGQSPVDHKASGVYCQELRCSRQGNPVGNAVFAAIPFARARITNHLSIAAPKIASVIRVSETCAAGLSQGRFISKPLSSIIPTELEPSSLR